MLTLNALIQRRTAQERQAMNDRRENHLNHPYRSRALDATAVRDRRSALRNSGNGSNS